MKRILILFASSHGQTAKIARALEARLRAAGNEVTVQDIATGDVPPPDGYDAVVLGSRLELGGFARAIARYAARHEAALAARWSGFYSVSLSAASRDAHGRAAAEEIIDKFAQSTEWYPTRVASFAGALPYTQYGLITRFVMKRISAANGGATDTSRDHEYTDWSAVDAFADTLVADLSRRPPAATPAPTIVPRTTAPTIGPRA